MLSIGRFAEQAQVSTRTVRYYESIGLLPKPSREENNYRSYSELLLPKMARIRDLQSLGFELEEIKSIFSFSDSELGERFQQRLSELNQEIENLEDRRKRLLDLLSVTRKVHAGLFITETERNLYMEGIREEIIEGLKTKYSAITAAELDYLERDQWLHQQPKPSELFEALRKCVAFAKKNGFRLGPGRGSFPASLTLFGMGFSDIDPMKYDMLPERLLTQSPQIHIDVEFERGQEFVDYCKEITKSLSCGEIHAFKMPLIDIVQNVHQSLGRTIDYNSISDDSDVVLAPFRSAEIDKIFSFDFSDNALVMKYENFLPEYLGLEKITRYLSGQKIAGFRDVLNITALWRPFNATMVSRMEAYRASKDENFKYDFLSPQIQKSLKPNHGHIIYHEDLIRIIADATQWDLARSNSLRRLAMNRSTSARKDAHPDWIEFTNIAPKPVVDLVAEESKWTFCLPHTIAFGQFTKQTAVLKTLHKDEYFAEIENFEQKHGFKWDDIGIRLKGVSLLQD